MSERTFPVRTGCAAAVEGDLHYLYDLRDVWDTPLRPITFEEPCTTTPTGSIPAGHAGERHEGICPRAGGRDPAGMPTAKRQENPARERHRGRGVIDSDVTIDRQPLAQDLGAVRASPASGGIAGLPLVQQRQRGITSPRVAAAESRSPSTAGDPFGIDSPNSLSP